MRILSIDVGIQHLALVTIETPSDYASMSVTQAQVVNITTVPCLRNCALAHSRNPVDWMAHVFEYYRSQFEVADEILIERQPLVGLVDIQALIYSKFRDKASLVSPNAMHKHFGLPRCDYEGRKLLTVEIARPYISHIPDLPERLHDVADAVSLALHQVRVRRERLLASARLHRLRERGPELEGNPFSKFGFHSLRRTPAAPARIGRMGLGGVSSTIGEVRQSSEEPPGEEGPADEASTLARLAGGGRGVALQSEGSS